MGKSDEAVAKLEAVANTYNARGDAWQAAAMYASALELAPVHSGVRARLTDLLVKSGRIDEALEQYLILADGYYQMAQMEQAIDTYEQALAVAPRGGMELQWQVRILHRVADIHIEHIDWQRAAATYEQIRVLDPDDERARLGLMQLHFRSNRPDLALAEVDTVSKALPCGQDERTSGCVPRTGRRASAKTIFRSRRAWRRHAWTAASWTRPWSSWTGWAICRWRPGRPQDATVTIRAILALKPANASEYRQILEELGPNAVNVGQRQSVTAAGGGHQLSHRN